MNILSINLEDLLYCRGVESARIEFKASWDEKTTGHQVIKTICAFANDLQNLNGGYIIIGVEESESCAIMPPKGISPSEIESIQKWVRGNCNRIDPEYQPVFSPEFVGEKLLLVIWVPASDNRPHKAPDNEKGEKKYFVRIGSESVDAEKNGVLRNLLDLTARVPFDARRALQARTEDMRETKVREFLRDVRSGLIEEDDTKELYRKMRIAVPVNGYDVPLNIGLLLFSEDPSIWFPGARIEVVQFSEDVAGDRIEETVFRGPIHEQLKAVLAYLENFSVQHFEKQNTSFRVRGWVSYPISALREAVVNAVYHRSYESCSEPIKIYLYPNRMEIISYPGPVLGIKAEHLYQREPMPPVPARNRRIGEFLKELRLAEGRGTGIPKLLRAMKENGSPEPRFDFDEDRSYFRVTLPAHPEYIAVTALRNAAYLRTIGNNTGALRQVEEAWKEFPGSPTLSAELIRLYGSSGKTENAERVYEEFKGKADELHIPFVTNVLIDVLHNAKRYSDATRLLDMQPSILSSSDALDAAILSRRLDKQEKAHRYFERVGDMILSDPRALLEFAQTKILLAKKAIDGGRFGKETNRRLLNEAEGLLERVVQLDTDQIRHAWAWRDLGRVKKWLRKPNSEIEAAYKQAMKLLPAERRFVEEYESWKKGKPGD